MDEARRHYRTSPHPGADLQVAVVGQHWKLKPRQVVDISGGGVCVILPSELPDTPVLGNVMILELGSSLLPAPIESAATVIQSDATDQGTVVRLQVLDWMGLAAMVPAEIAQLLNLRAGPRFELDPAAPVRIALRGVDIAFTVDGVLRDISRGGLALHAPLIAECALRKTDRIQVTFELPALDRKFSFVAAIRHRHLAGDSVCYGVCFDADATPDFQAQQAAIEGFIQERQQTARHALKSS
jgi:hypothetical protein